MPCPNNFINSFKRSNSNIKVSQQILDYRKIWNLPVHLGAGIILVPKPTQIMQEKQKQKTLDFYSSQDRATLKKPMSLPRTTKKAARIHHLF